MKKRIWAALCAVLLCLSAAAGEEALTGGLEADKVGLYSGFGTFSGGYSAYKKDGLYGIVDRDGRVVTEPVWPYVYGFVDGYAVVSDKDWTREDSWLIREDDVGVGARFAIVDGEGNMTVDWTENILTIPEENGYGLAAFMTPEDTWGYMDMEGRVVIEPVYRAQEWDWWDLEFGFGTAFGFPEGVRWMFEGYGYNEWAGTTGRGIWRCVRADGAVLMERKYDFVRQYSEGLAAVKVDGKWGFLDREGNVVIPPEWDSVGNFEDGLASIMRDRKRGLIDSSGRIVVEPEFNSVERCEGNVFIVGTYTDTYYYNTLYRGGEGLVSGETWPGRIREMDEGVFKVSRDSRQGLVDADMNMILDLEWANLDYHEGWIAGVKDGKFHLLDPEGRETLTLPATWNGRYFVSDHVLREYTDEDKVRYIDLEGQRLGSDWDMICLYLDDVEVAFQGEVQEWDVDIPGDGEFFFVDKATGRTVNDRRWAEVDYDPYWYEVGWTDQEGVTIEKDGMLPARELREDGTEGKWGFVSAEMGQTAVEPMWDEVKDFSEGRAFVKKDGLWYVIDTEGNVLTK